MIFLAVTPDPRGQKNSVSARWNLSVPENEKSYDFSIIRANQQFSGHAEKASHLPVAPKARSDQKPRMRDGDGVNCDSIPSRIPKINLTDAPDVYRPEYQRVFLGPPIFREFVVEGFSRHHRGRHRQT